MLFQSTVVVALLASFTAAQTTSTSTANSTIDPSTISATLRSQWCQGQINTCGTLCSGDASNNTCLPETLSYSCLCAANDSAPGLQYYTTTMPTFICQQIFTNCNLANVGDAASQATCAKNQKANCGGNDPSTFVAVVATTSAASTSTASSTGTAAVASGTGTASSSTSAGAAPTMGANFKYFGTGALAVGLGAMGLLI